MRQAAVEKLLELAVGHPEVLFLASDVGEEVVAKFRARCPDQLFIEGISEGHLIGMAAGLAKDGDVVFVNTIASFLTRRCFDQIAVNLCLDDANVKLLGQGGGLVYGPHGPTHHAIEDLALMRALPGMTVIAPCDRREAQQAMEFALGHRGPVYIRLAKGTAKPVSPQRILRAGAPVIYKNGKRAVLLATGVMTQVALEAAADQNDWGVIGVPFLKPFAESEIADFCRGADLVATLEEHVPTGGLTSCVCEALVRNKVSAPEFVSFTLPDAFADEYGKQESLLQGYGLDAGSVSKKIQARLKEKS